MDVGRLRRHEAPERGSYSEFSFNRVADRVESLYLVFSPSAAELVASSFPGDEEAIEAALDEVDRRVERLRRLLGREVAA